MVALLILSPQWLRRLSQTVIQVGQSKAYTTIAILVFNTLICGIMFLVISDITVNLVTFDTGRELYSQGFKPDTYKLTSSEDIEIIGKEFDALGWTDTFVFNPWTVFSATPYKGQKLNVTEGDVINYRVTQAADPAYADQPPLQIWAFGGSTLFGWGVADEHTIATQLQIILQKQLPHRQVIVTNYGQPYFFSTQEVSLYIALLRAEDPPGIAIFLDGLNDGTRLPERTQTPDFTQVAATGFAEQRTQLYDNTSPWLKLTPRFPLNRLINYFAGQNKREATVVLPEATTEGTTEGVYTHRLNRQLITALSREFDVQPYIFLQPISPFVLPSFNTAYYDALKSEMSAPFYDLSSELDEFGVDVYVDGSHYSDLGCQILAQAIADTLQSQIAAEN